MKFIIISHQGLRYLRKLGKATSNGYSQEEILFLREIGDQKIHKDKDIKIPNRPHIIEKLREKRDIVVFEE